MTGAADGRALIHDVISAVDENRPAGDKLCRIMREHGGGDPDVVDAH